MERRHKLSCLSDVEIERYLNTIDFEIDTDREILHLY